MKEISIGRQLKFDFDNNLLIDVMENTFEQMASTQQSDKETSSACIRNNQWKIWRVFT